MSKQLHVSKDLTLPLDAVTSTFVVVGIRGSGKSTTAVVMAEEMLKAHQQIVVLDPKDDWWGIRSSADREAPGWPVTIMGGTHQDVPLEATAGALVARFILDERISAILATKQWSDGQRFRFTYDFCDYLYKHCQEPMHLFLDEADQFAPQEKQTKIFKDPNLTGQQVSEAMMLSLVRRVIKQGRTSGLGVSLITQSPATLDKRVMNMCETMVAMRVVGAQDFDAVEKWFKVYLRKKGDLEKIVSELPTLRAGQGVFYSPAWLEVSKIIQFRMAETFDSRQTPKVGERRVEPKVLAPVDLDRLSKQMVATIEKAKAEDPRELKKEIAILSRENEDLKRHAPARDQDQRRIVQLEEQVESLQSKAREKTAPIKITEIKLGDIDRLEKLPGQYESFVSKLVTLQVEAKARAEAIGKLVSDAKALNAEARGIKEQPASVPTQVSVQRVPIEQWSPPAATRMRAPDPAATNGDRPKNITGGAKRILESLANNPTGKLTRSQLGSLAKLKTTGGTFGDYVSRLRVNGLIDVSGNDYSITDAGREFVGIYTPTPRSSDDILAMWTSTGGISGGCRRMLTLLFNLRRSGSYHDDFVKINDTYGLSRDELAKAVGLEVTGGTFGDYLSRLRSNGLIQERNGVIYASDTFFINERVPHAG